MGTIIISPILVLTLVVFDHQAVYGEIKVGEINRDLKHDVEGKVYYMYPHTLKIKSFTYDGKGPDAFFLAGTEGKPSDCTQTVCRGATILPYPFNRKFYDYDDQTIPIIKGAFTGDKEITLRTPKSLRTTDIKWFSVWCREYAVDFGHVFFNLTNIGKDVTPETQPETESGPETPDEITKNSPETSQDQAKQQENGSASFKIVSLVISMLMIFCGLMLLPSL